MEENWNEIKTTLKFKWEQLSDHELQGFKGSADQLVQMIQRRTGQAKNRIDNQLEETISQGRSIQKQVGEHFSGAASQTGEACEEGYGASIAANKVSGVRAAPIHDVFYAHQGVEDDAMNVVCLGGQVIGPALAWELIQTFLSAQFTGVERHKRRLAKVQELDGWKVQP